MAIVMKINDNENNETENNDYIENILKIV